MPTSTTPTTAVVLGGSLAGLLTAVAIRPHVDRVVVLERDTLGPVAGPRPGTPQVAQAHGLLPSGRVAMETLLPGITRELLDEGAVSYGDFGVTGRWWIGGGALAPTPIGQTGLGVSRAGLETVVRRRVRALGGIEVRDGVEVCGLRTTPDRDRVTGVRWRPAGSRADGEVLAADLVVDASGRAGRMVGWLADLGLPGPDEERVEVDIRYATAHVARTPDDDASGMAVHVSGSTPEVPRGGVAIAQEDGSWVVLLFGLLGDHPPTDPDGWRAFARRVVCPTLAELADRPLLDAVRPFGFPASVRRRYDRLRELPAGVVVLGDAFASFNPAYGQGMSVAAMEAVAVGETLTRTTLATGTRRLQRRIATVSSRAWDVQRGADVAIPGVDGPSMPGDARIGAYVRAVQVAARRDPVVAAAFFRVVALLAAPPSLMHPRIALRVLRARLADRAGGTTEVPEVAGVPAGR